MIASYPVLDRYHLWKVRAKSTIGLMQPQLLSHHKSPRLNMLDRALLTWLYIRENIPSKLRNSDLSIEGFFADIRLRKKKWLLCSSYNPKKNLIANHLNCIGRNLDSQLGQYENFILMGDFNVEPNDATMKNFCQISVKFLSKILSKIRPVSKVP